MHLARTISSPWNTGRSTILLGPMIATSGRLITGVVAIPPNGPSEVIVSVDPESSSDLALPVRAASARSEEHTSELQSLMRISYAVFCLKKNKQKNNHTFIDSNYHNDTKTVYSTHNRL